MIVCISTCSSPRVPLHVVLANRALGFFTLPWRATRRFALIPSQVFSTTKEFSSEQQARRDEGNARARADRHSREPGEGQNETVHFGERLVLDCSNTHGGDSTCFGILAHHRRRWNGLPSVGRGFIRGHADSNSCCQSGRAAFRGFPSVAAHFERNLLLSQSRGYGGRSRLERND